ncbi:MAG: hypothetical protein HY584_00705 [Candidatus Omnitrophica bacterium]|nr:hypothetical protein [Candidatus Omnitrophota bacterium]
MHTPIVSSSRIKIRLTEHHIRCLEVFKLGITWSREEEKDGNGCHCEDGQRMDRTKQSRSEIASPIRPTLAPTRGALRCAPLREHFFATKPAESVRTNLAAHFGGSG